MIFEQQQEKRGDKRPMFIECLKKTDNGNNVLVCGGGTWVWSDKTFSSIHRYLLKDFSQSLSFRIIIINHEECQTGIINIIFTGIQKDTKLIMIEFFF